jgi:hypothetical protein
MALGIEHSVLLMRVFIITALPHMPAWVDVSRRQLEWYQKNMKDGLDIKAEKEHQTIFEDK